MDKDRQLQVQILGVAFRRFDGTFSNREDQANNKLELEVLQGIEELAEPIIRRLGGLAMQYDPDFVVGIPNGANWLAAGIAEARGLELVTLTKDRVTDKMSFASELDRDKCRQGTQGVLIEDIFRKFTNTKRALEIPLLAERTIAAVAIWDRGLMEYRQRPDIDTKALITHHIPDILPDDSPLWKYAA